MTTWAKLISMPLITFIGDSYQNSIMLRKLIWGVLIMIRDSTQLGYLSHPLKLVSEFLI